MYPGKRVNKQIGYLIKVSETEEYIRKAERAFEPYVPYISYLHPKLIRPSNSIKMGWATLEGCEEALNLLLSNSTPLYTENHRFDIVKVTVIEEKIDDEELIDDDELEN